MNYAIGRSISLTLTSQQGKRLDCTATITGHAPFGPVVTVESPEFKAPVTGLELVGEEIELVAGDLRYAGEIGGAVLVPDFLWKNPKK